jgi:hypothetical protein
MTLGFPLFRSEFEAQPIARDRRRGLSTIAALAILGSDGIRSEMGKHAMPNRHRNAGPKLPDEVL